MSRTARSSAWNLPEVRWALVALAFFAAGGVLQLAGAPGWLWWTLYLACHASGGWGPGLAGVQALRARTLDVDLLMVVAAIGAAAIGQVFDGALLIVIFATSGALEAVATKRTEDSVRSLFDLAPPTATRLTAAGEEEPVDSALLDVGDVLLIRPGERVGGDGLVLDGVSEVDQATITGEPLPVAKTAGDEVFAGTVNGTGTLRVRVTRPAADTVVARISAMVTEASASKARTQLFIEKIEQRYSVGMVVATVAIFVIPVLLGESLQAALLRAMTFMIVASPCALVLSTMPPMLAAIANAGRHGVLVKSAVVLEKLARVSRVAFDKTGTLTEGNPWVTAVCPLPDSGLSEEMLLSLVAAAESPSEHPLARAVVASARRSGVSVPAASGFSSKPGRGVSATVEEDHVFVGSSALLDDLDPARAVVDDIERGGSTAVVVQLNGRTVGVLGLADRPRDRAADTIAALARLTGAQPVLLTGDNSRAAGQLAGELGIADVRAGLLPEDKVREVRALEDGGAHLMLVGDGVNDAPAMATAYVSAAMGRSGSDLTLDTADAVITRDDLGTLPAVVALARRARRVVIANLAIAATFIVVLVAWDLFGHLPLPLGVAGHEGSTILVGLNGLRLLREKAWRR
ncbi:heavy metal translocating P-type ATPase [Mycobacterium sp. NAZ190054]|uniref:heavy metal translocating P-type ATPase n=1 Tax=Mycobacterium sp. NAZ190054 TaxID=1747766 RepID=UPI0007948C61|nr:heavy metal translocating P-type ATPase [Mycobacterium sp. NAZ190054]KWX66482.1 metal-transporting ATPase [Mycobacterium sp. NAZ190054]